ncbi:zeta toxin family protein (plasmid) [Streptomyces sp. NBC_00045]
MEARRMLRRAMRPRTVVLDPDLLRGHHPDHFQLVNAPPRRRASEAGYRGLAGCVRERRGDLLIEADFTGAADFTLSAGRFARTDYRIEVVALAGPTADSRQRTLVNYARALELDVVTALPAPAAHARACQVSADIVAAAAADPAVSAVQVIDGDHRALGRDRWSAWALAAARRRLYTAGEAARFHSVQRALHQVLPRLREEADDAVGQAYITVLAETVDALPLITPASYRPQLDVPRALAAPGPGRDTVGVLGVCARAHAGHPSLLHLRMLAPDLKLLVSSGPRSWSLLLPNSEQASDDHSKGLGVINST